MRRYIDADALIETIENDCPEVVYYTKRDAIDCIQAQPTADVVEVVRCDDCKHKDSCNQYVLHYGDECELAFCSYGELYV